MKEYPCYLCGAQSFAVIDAQDGPDTYLAIIAPELQRGARALAACAECGFVQHVPKLEPAEIDTLYRHFRDHSLTTETPDQYFDRITVLPPGQSENQDKIEWLAPRLVERFGPRGPRSALDIGCGGGVFLWSLRRRFPDAGLMGVEPTTQFAELAARRLGIPVDAEGFDSKRIGRTFEAVFLNQVLEHVFDPVAFLADVARVMDTRSVLYVEVPDVADLGYLAPDHDRFMAQHLHVFSAPALKEVLRRAGLRTIVEDAAVTVRGKRNLLVLAERGSAPEQNWRVAADEVRALRRALRGQ